MDGEQSCLPKEKVLLFYSRRGTERRAMEIGQSSQVKQDVGLVYSSPSWDHRSRHDTHKHKHPECPERVSAIQKKLEEAGLDKRCALVNNSKGATTEQLLSVHSEKHVEKINSTSSMSKATMNKTEKTCDDVYFNKFSSRAAVLAAGTVLEAAEQVATGKLKYAFAIVRPPGHHAENTQAMGYCLYNNVAIAAKKVLENGEQNGIDKILIVDWDVHHGNATQKMFWEDNRVLFFSVHRHDPKHFYPDTEDGSHTMIGDGKGKGFNINVPWKKDKRGDHDYIAVWDNVLIPVAKEFEPDMIIISAGFDAAINDVGGCCVSPYGYSVLLSKLMDITKGKGKIVLALEGGYDLDSLSESVCACVETLLEEKPCQVPDESTRGVIEEVRELLKEHWKGLSGELRRTSNESPDDQKVFNAATDETMTVQRLIEQVEQLKKERDDAKKNEGKLIAKADKYKRIILKKLALRKKMMKNDPSVNRRLPIKMHAGSTSEQVFRIETTKPSFDDIFGESWWLDRN